MTLRSGIGAGAMAVGQRERTLSPYPATDVFGLKHINSRRAAFVLGFVAIILTFVLPGSLLNDIGLYSYQPGGNPLAKFHPCHLHGDPRFLGRPLWQEAGWRLGRTVP